MNELTVARTPETVGAEIRSLSAAAKYTTLCYAVEIGRRLVEAKELVPHGEWGNFLKEQTEFSSSGAGRMMQLFREYGDAKANFPTLGNISVSNALRLLAVPEEERESFAAEVDAEHISGRELEEAIKAREAAEQALEEAKKELAETSGLLDEKTDQYAALTAAAKSLKDDAEEARRKIEELENRPIEVAVQEPDPEEIERRVSDAVEQLKAQHAAEEKALRDKALEAGKDRDNMATERDELQRKLKAAEERLKTPANTGAEERLTGEVEALKKQLAMSSEGMTVFKLRFAAWQAAYAAMQEAMGSLTEEQKAKCTGAVRAQIGAWEA